MTALILSTYPFVKPSHGGMFRLASIAEAYRANGFQVKSIAVYRPECHSPAERGETDLPFPDKSPFRRYDGEVVPSIEDLQSGKFGADNDVFQQLRTKLPDEVSLIVLEQCFLLPLARRLIEIYSHCKPRLVYSSHNIEAPLKSDLLIFWNVRENLRGRIIDEIQALEVSCAREADLCVAVTDKEKKTLESFGGSRVVLAPNGVVRRTTTPELIARWRKRLPPSPWLLYVASAYMPNIQGFFEHFGNTLGYLPPGVQIVTVGGCGEAIQQRCEGLRYGSIVRSHLRHLGSLSDDDLAAVTHSAHGFIVPLGIGGGSNLKTAEAIVSGKWIVTTETGMRGYEEFADLPEILIAKDSRAFRQAVVDVLARPPVHEPAEPERRMRVLWENTLQDYMTAVKELL